jgi:hypothetical protein
MAAVKSAYALTWAFAGVAAARQSANKADPKADETKRIKVTLRRR